MATTQEFGGFDQSVADGAGAGTAPAEGEGVAKVMDDTMRSFEGKCKMEHLGKLMELLGG